MREVTVLGTYRHPNLVPLLSFSLSRRDDGQQEACLVLDQCLTTFYQFFTCLVLTSFLPVFYQF